MAVSLKKNFIGFTLAEVLITLGIIGVIAGMTIPLLMTQIQDRQFKEAAKAAYSKAAQAVQQMKQDEGGSLSGYYGNSKSFSPVFMTYLKIVKDCGMYGSPGGETCVITSPDGSSGYTSLTGDVANTGSIGGEGSFITSDGMFWTIQNTTTFSNRIFIMVDVNGYLKGPNVFGRDAYVFELLNDNLIPMGAKNTYFPSNTYCQRTPSSIAAGFGCMVYVMQGIDY